VAAALWLISWTRLGVQTFFSMGAKHREVRLSCSRVLWIRESTHSSRTSFSLADTCRRFFVIQEKQILRLLGCLPVVLYHTQANEQRQGKGPYLDVLAEAGSLALHAPTHLAERAHARQHAGLCQHRAELVQVDDGGVHLDSHAALRVRPCRR